MVDRSVISIAIGKPYYLFLARNLLYSFLLWNKNTGIKFLLLTDNTFYFNEFFNNPQVQVVYFQLKFSEKSFTSKFLLFEYLIAKENLFIDCDCLIYRNLEFVFDQMGSSDFTTIGQNVKDGTFFCDVPETIKRFGLTSMPKFVGAIYYIKNSSISANIFDLAKELKNRYDEMGFIRLRGKENEEPLFALAMSKCKQEPILDDGSIKADRMFYRKIKSNVRTGKAFLSNKNLPLNPEIYNRLTSNPAIVHYNDSYSETNHYLSEACRLKNQRLPIWTSELYIFLRYRFTEFIIVNLKDIFRPIFHSLYGALPIRKNKRI